MKRSIPLLTWLWQSVALCLLCGATSFGASPQNAPNNDLFVAGNTAFRQGNYEEALKTYRLIPEKNGHIYYNMGNAAFKAHQPGYALLYWRKAERLTSLFNRAELRDNIKKLRVQKILPHEQKRSWSTWLSTWKEALYAFFIALPLGGLQVLFLLLWALIFIYMRYLYRRRYRLMLSTCFLALIFVGSALLIRSGIELRSYGVIVAQQAPLLSGPNESFQILCTLPEAHEVLVKKTLNAYYKVRFGRLTGWIAQQHVGLI